MKRRTFMKLAGAATLVPPWSAAEGQPVFLSLRNAAVLLSRSSTAREAKAATVLVEESEKRCGLTWLVGKSRDRSAQVTIALATRQSLGGLSERFLASDEHLRGLAADGFVIRSGTDARGAWIAIVGADERGLLFGVGKLLRLINFGRMSAEIPASGMSITSSPKYRLRGHQLGYRPKTNAYDGWTVDMWDQYIRDLAIFGTNAIELVPPRTDDMQDSPQFPLPPLDMMVRMSQIADSYGIDVWVWYPPMDSDYSNPKTVDVALHEWRTVLANLPRLDAIFVPGGDPGHSEPKYLLALLEVQKKSLVQDHPNLQAWVSPQGFNADWMEKFITIISQPETQSWLDGVVFGPQSRLSLDELRSRVPQHYPIRDYPDITHSTSCQYPVPDWDLAFALTEGREVINPRPQCEAEILRQSLPQTIGFLTYSEGCNDDLNKFVWSALGWDPGQPVITVLRDFSHYFIGSQQEEGVALGLLDLERNWQGMLATNDRVDLTLERFRDLENAAAPAVLENWRFQQVLYRAYYDAFVRRRLLRESGLLAHALDILGQVDEFGWSALPLNIGEMPSSYPSNRRDPDMLIDAAIRVLEEPDADPEAAALRTRITELGYALFQSIHMQLAVERYQGEAVERAANLDTLDTPLTDIPWLRKQLANIKSLGNAEKQVASIRAVLSRTDPGPGGFYDELGNIANRPHLTLGPGPGKDPELRQSPQIGFSYPDRWGAAIPNAWKRWAGSLYDAAIEMRYEGLDPSSAYTVRVVYSGNQTSLKIGLKANDNVQIHPYIERTWPPALQEFPIPVAATSEGSLKLTWTREPGLGGNGTGCQVSEVWLIPADKSEAPS
jgi:hypothetical protein